MKQASRQLIRFWIDQLNKFAESSGYQIKPLPKVMFVDGNQQKNDADDLLIQTGGYQPQAQQIILYIDGRHLKDIIRSYCHELVHHMQNLDNHDYLIRVFKQKSEDVIDNPELEELESEAYLKGNILIRKFTEWFKKQHQKQTDKH